MRVAGRLAFLERVRLTPEARALDPAAGQGYTGTLVAVGSPDEPWQKWAAELEALAVPADARVGASALAASGLAMRVLAASACSLTAVFESRWSALRRGLLGRPPLALRKP